MWIVFSVYISASWIKDFSKIVSLPAAIIIITGIAYVPGYLNTFLVVSLIMDRQPPLKDEYPLEDITILIAAKNEADKIENTLVTLLNKTIQVNIKYLLSTMVLMMQLQQMLQKRQVN